MKQAFLSFFIGIIAASIAFVSVQSVCAGYKDKCQQPIISPLPSESVAPYETPEEVPSTVIPESPEASITPQIDTPAIATQTPVAGASGGFTDDKLGCSTHDCSGNKQALPQAPATGHGR